MPENRLGLQLPVRPFPNGTRAKATAPPGPVASGVFGGEVKAANPPVDFIPYGRDITYLLGGLPPDFADFRTLHGRAAYAAAAIVYSCVEMRCKKIVQAPLMVERETKKGTEWVTPHALDALLMKPNPDFGMRRMLYATEAYLLLTGRALWVKNRIRQTGETASMYCFSGDDFQVEKANGRLFGRFRVKGSSEWLAPEQVVFFQYFHPTDPWAAVAPVDAAVNALNIGQTLQGRVRHMVKNAFAAGAMYIADKDKRFDDTEFDRAKHELNTLFQGVNTGKTALVEGGGRIERGWSLGDLQLGELWRETEVQLAGVFGIPAAIAPTIVGLENSPWSHMDTARKVFYQDTIVPEWEFLAECLTDQLLRDVDDRADHAIVFDGSSIPELQPDREQNALIASAISRIASVNERRILVGLEPVADPKANDIPELNQPDLSELLRGNNTPPNSDDPDEETDDEKAERVARETKQRNIRVALFDAITQSIEISALFAASVQLDADRDAIVSIFENAKSADQTTETKDDTRKRINALRADAEAYLKTRARARWSSIMGPVLRDGAKAAGAFVAADLGFAGHLLNDDLLEYAEREVGWLIKGITNTTRDAVRTAVRDGFASGEDSRAIAQRLRDLPAFNRDRAMLVARTESTRVANNAPTEALQSYAKRSGQSFTKTWSAVLDDRVRDEHAEMDGETVGINDAFSNGLQAPGEPNCRCTLFYGVAE